MTDAAATVAGTRIAADATTTDALPDTPGSHRLEHVIGRVLTAGTVAGIVVLAAGVLTMAAAGTSPLSGGRRLDPASIAGDIGALRPDGFLWVGLVVLIATPSARVAASLVGFAAAGDRRMTLIAAAVLAVIALTVALGSGA